MTKTVAKTVARAKAIVYTAAQSSRPGA